MRRLCAMGCGLLLLGAGASLLAQEPMDLPTPEPAPAPRGRPILDIRESYFVNAQFRGSVVKSFENLGNVGVGHRQLASSLWTVGMGGEIRDPELPDAVYRFSADVEFDWKGAEVRTTARGRFSKDAEEYREDILAAAPFVLIVKFAPLPPRGARDAVVDFRVNGRPYSLRYAWTDRHVEVTLYDDLRTAGKFFLFHGPADAMHEYDKFRINTANRTVLSFVRERPGVRPEDVARDAEALFGGRTHGPR